MAIYELLYFFLIIGVCTIIAQAVFDFKRYTIVFSFILGTFGAFIGIQIANALQLPELFTLQFGESNIPIIWSIMGSGIFAFVINPFIKRG